MAVVGLEGMRFTAPHGFYAEEKVLKNSFLVDVYLATDTHQAAHLDELNETVNYETVYHMVQAEMKKPTHLIETLAERIVLRLHDFYETISGVKVIVRKLNPPVGGEVAAAYIEQTTGVFARGSQQKPDFI
ncbi:MAG: dihydroneopterin aldolase [Bacteroidetes bacterium]|nr:MAG: dihydroneopterin aldolase [Bacteroidota bacterium]